MCIFEIMATVTYHFFGMISFIYASLEHLHFAMHGNYSNLAMAAVFDLIWQLQLPSHGNQRLNIKTFILDMVLHGKCR